MTRPDRPNYAPEVKRSLTDVRRLCEQLGLVNGPRSVLRQACGLIVRCPWHEERTPSCSIRIADDGTIAVRCHGCDASGDVLSLIAQVRGLSIRRDFREVLLEGARLAGLWAVVADLEGRSTGNTQTPPQNRPVAPPPEPMAPRTYPDGVEAFWDGLKPLATDPEAAEYLRGRAIDPDVVDALDLARAIPGRGALPRWATYQGRSWREGGYRIVVPTWSSAGVLTSVRAWRVTNGEGPKRLPPSGHKAVELVMVDAFGLAMLRGTRVPERVVVLEGEPDFLTWGSRLNDPRTAIMGIISGSWSRGLAERFPVGCRVDVRTDHDQAGDRYFREIESGLRRRCFVYRSVADGRDG